MTARNRPICALNTETSIAALDVTFEAFIFDWDGTAVPDRKADATKVRERIERLSGRGVHIFIVSGTNVENIDGQLRARPTGRGRLYLCCNRGSEIFEVDANGPMLLFRRSATDRENRSLDSAGAQAVDSLRARGLEVNVISDRLNRRKIDLIPEPEWADPKKADIARLRTAVATRLGSKGVARLAEVVALMAASAKAAGLRDPRITSDVKHVEIGLTDKSDSARFAAGWLAERGITGELIAIVGDELGTIGSVAGSDSLMMVDELARAAVISVGIEPEGVPSRVVHLGGGPARFLGLFDAQVTRRKAHRVPQIDADPSWIVPMSTTHAAERVSESLATLANGYAATRGSRTEEHEGASPLFLVNGIYTNDGRLLHGPGWTRLLLPETRRKHSERRLLDLRTATLMRFDEKGVGLRSMRFMSGALPHAMALRAESNVDELEPGDTLRPPLVAHEFAREEKDGASIAETRRVEAAIAIAARDHTGTSNGYRIVERMATWIGASNGVTIRDDARRLLAEVEAIGFDALLAEHRESWAHRWANAEVVIEGDPESELAARFAIFHLLSAAPESGEAAVGARGLTGDAYAGHVFWDADMFVLPVLCAIAPAAARAMLEYRIRRLPAARAEARSRGLEGARFPWESAGDGHDVTPREARGRHGEIIPIATGVYEEHIVADVAWAAAHYSSWTGDAGFLTGAGRDLIVDTARYWASRIRRDPAGHGHLYGVMGPDEYHEVVDDNAYTNVMARWNLRRGAELLENGGGSLEAASWRVLAESMVDGWNPERGIYEQFGGYFDLEPLLVSQVAPPPVAVDVLLGAERVAASQLIKQADVLMLHHLMPEEVVTGSLAPCLSFYEPRTAHGSSLSPAIFASLLARAGQPERALELFRLAARLDLDDRTGTTAGGLHLATMGGVWQALAYGFLGLHADAEGTLAINPCLPAAWHALGLIFRFAGNPIGVRAEHDLLTVTCDAPLLVKITDRLTQCDPPGMSVPLSAPSAPSAPSTQRSLR
jgi:trehalose/maltose hydrolase-like predicted phosphorylase